MYLLGIRVPFFVEERDCSLTQKAEAPPGTWGRFGGIPFKEDPNAPRPQKRRIREGGTARESKNETREKGTVRSRRNCLKNMEAARDCMERI